MGSSTYWMAVCYNLEGLSMCRSAVCGCTMYVDVDVRMCV